MQSNGNNTGIIWQVGDDNTASINQQGNSSSFKADIYQNGFKGDVSISQSGSGLRGVSVQQQNLSGNARPVTIDTYWVASCFSVNNQSKSIEKRGNTMKTQMTVIAAAVAMAVSFSSQARDFDNSTTNPAANAGSNPAFVNQQ